MCDVAVTWPLLVVTPPLKQHPDLVGAREVEREGLSMHVWGTGAPHPAHGFWGEQGWHRCAMC